MIVYPIISLAKDLALIQISPPFKKSQRVKPISINDVYPDLKGQRALISGWGRMWKGESGWVGARQLQKTNVTIRKYINRRPGTSRKFFGRFMALWSPNGKGAAKGDSGGNDNSQKR